MSGQSLRHVTIERRPHGLAIVENKTREVLDLTADADVAERRARAWDRVFHVDGDRDAEASAPPELVTSRGTPLAEAPASRSRVKSKRVREFRTALRDPRDRAGKWMPLVFESSHGGVPAGAIYSMFQVPQFVWRGEFLRVDRACAPHFRIVCLMVGVYTQTASYSSEMPATLFAQTRRWFRWTLDIASPGHQIRIDVRNVSAEPRAFDAVILGREITRIETAPRIAFRSDQIVVDPGRASGGPYGVRSYGHFGDGSDSGIGLASDYDGKGSRR